MVTLAHRLKKAKGLCELGCYTQGQLRIKLFICLYIVLYMDPASIYQVITMYQAYHWGYVHKGMFFVLKNHTIY